MLSCETCQTQLLHHLYGLLEDGDRQAMAAHLGTCANCQTALETARRQQSMLAVAAKSEFPDVRFAPVPQSAQLVPTIEFREKEQSQTWLRWAVAACILVLLGGAGTFAGIAWNGYRNEVHRARDELARAERDKQDLLNKAETEEERIGKELRAIEEQIKQLETQFQSELGTVQRDFKNQQVDLSVSHPKTLQAGAANKLTVQTVDRAGAPLKRDFVLIAQVVNDKTKATVSQMVLYDGGNDFILPANLPIVDGDQLTLRVLAVDQKAPLAAGGVAGGNPLMVPGTVFFARPEQTLFQETLPLVTSIYVTHLMTDRPLYRPGETVYFRSLTLERFGLKPAAQDFELHYKLVRMIGGQEKVEEVLDPDTQKPAKLTGLSKLKNKDGTPLFGPDGKEIRGIGAGAFHLPEALPGGEYTLIVSEGQNRFPPEKRKIIVNQYQAPRLYKDVDFTRKSYGPGDLVTALCKVAAVEGGKVLSGQPVKVATAQVDGKSCVVISKAPLFTDERGECTVQFRLPSKIDKGEGVLAVEFTDGANVETQLEPIPIVLSKLKVDFYPEGGELIGGVKNRVYFQVRTTVNKPAELRGRIVDDAGKDVATIETLADNQELGVNQGMGRFDFTPQAGKTYELKIDAPRGIEGRHLLPPVQNDGVVLHLPSGVVTHQIDVLLTSAKKNRKLLVGAYCRGKLLDHQTVMAEAGKPVELALKPASGVGGVYRVTVFEVTDDQLRPVAERLLYRRSPDKLNILFSAKKQYTPGEKVTLSLTATNEFRQPAPAILVVSIVDKSILKLRNDRTARSMPAHFLLTSEVRGPEDLEYADFLLLEEPRTAFGFEVAKAAVALDLLLGTQGWRRFIEQQLPEKVAEVQAYYKDDAERLATVTGQTKEVIAPQGFVSKRVSRVIGPAAVQHEALEMKLTEKEANDDAVRTAHQTKLNQMQLAVDLKRQQWGIAEQRERGFYDNVLRYCGMALVVVIPLVSMVLIVVGLSRANQGKRNGLYLLATGVGLFACLLIGGGVFLIGELFTILPGSDRDAAHQGAMKRANMAEEADDNAVAMRMAPAPGGKGVQKDDVQKGALVPMPGDPGVVNLKGAPKAVGKKPGLEPKPPVPEVLGDEIGAGIPAKQKKMWAGEWADKRGDFVNEPFKEWRGPGQLAFDTDRQLRKQGKAIEVTHKRLLTLQQKTLRDISPAVKMLAKVEPMLVRQYAHQHTPTTEGIRTDFTETVFWHPVLVLPGDKATDITFDLSDAVTRFEVQAWGHTLDGRLGAATMDIASQLPFNIDAKVPLEISSTDKVAIPVAVVNDTAKNLNVTFKVGAKNLKLTGQDELQFPLGAESRKREVLQFQPDSIDGIAEILLSARSDPFGVDAVKRTFKIVPEGFPVLGKQSDLLEGVCEHTILLPAKREQWVKGTLKLQVEVFPSTLADLQKGLEALLREPYGCFEQTSSSNYPNVLILDYLKESSQVLPAVEKKALALMDKGYGRLVSFECIDPATKSKKEGYEWFGQTAPPHEALTAYGLLQFTDMAKYQPVDQTMVERTRKYLLGQRNGAGGFKRNKRALDGFGRAPDHITDAYIVWALLESGVKDDLGTELNALLARVEADARQKKDDPYLIALVSLSMHQAGRKDVALGLLKKLQTLQQNDGKLVGATTSITHSGGSQLAIETTSLAVLAWLRVNQPQEFHDSVNKAAKWIGTQRGGFGGFGSTQSTVLALKALIAHTKANKQTASAGELRLFVNGNEHAVAVKAFPAGMLDPIVVELPDENLLQPGTNTIRVQITGDKNSFPHTLTWTYNALTPANSEACPVRLVNQLSTDNAVEGQTVRMTALLKNASRRQGHGMAVAILGLPAGLALPTDLQELRELVRAGKIDAFEIRGRELVIYWRELAPNALLEVNVNLICQLPGQYRGPASRAYLYYDADQRWWIDPLAISIQPK
jgi:hypothetical protein